MIRRLEELDLNGKRVFVRVDFNVPINQGRIMETHRIDSTLPTLRFIMGKAEKLVIASHLGRPGGKKAPGFSLAPVRDYLEQSLGCSVSLAPDCVGPGVAAWVEDPRHKVILLENLRFHKEEEKNDAYFSQALASLAHVYVNDAFGAAHRAHASTAGMVKLFHEKGAGFLLQKELDYLGGMLATPEHPFAFLLGGAKVSDKIAMLRNLMPKVSSLLIGGGMAYTFLKAKGVPVGKSLVEEDRIPLAKGLIAQAEQLGTSLLLPIDHIAAEEINKQPITSETSIPPHHKGLDIGPKTIACFQQAIQNARMILWNGPVGLFEVEPFGNGTRSMAQALADSQAVSIVAGGETVAAVRQAGVEQKISHLSTGGGATLEFLEGKELPGVQALMEVR
ncbi:MAG: phosphoglycerate kinase [Candidatus Binatia bacterium]